MASKRMGRGRLRSSSDSSVEYTREDDGNGGRLLSSDASSSSTMSGEDGEMISGELVMESDQEEEDDENTMRELPSVCRSLPNPDDDSNTRNVSLEQPPSIHDSSTAPSNSKSSKPPSLKFLKMDRKQMMTALSKSPNPFQSSISTLLSMYKDLHNYWLNQISAGYNILLYGYGSKLNVMQEFCKAKLSNSWHLVVNGFFPGLSIKQILGEICSDVLDHRGSFRNHIHQCDFICRSLCEEEDAAPDELFLIIHNIDGVSLRDEKSQTALSFLAACPKIHIIASIDHLNAPLLWDEIIQSRYNWAWQDATTFEPYLNETSYENSMLMQQSGALAMSSLTHVLHSLPERAQKIFELMATYHLEHKQDSTYTGQSFTELYRKCRERFLSNSDSALRAQLIEFLDHKLIRSRKTTDGTETLIVLVDEHTLEQFINREEEL